MKAFFDIEAPGADGYLIEVGWAIVVGPAPQIETGSPVIRPAERRVVVLPWSTDAEALHAILLDCLLAEGVAQL